MTRESPMQGGWTGPHLVSNSALPDEHFIREGAILFLATECALGHDSHEAENAVAFSRAFVDAYEGSEHSGDCTNECHTCNRCMCDEALSQAREQHDA